MDLGAAMEEEAKRQMDQRKRLKALRAKDISERMFLAKDFKGAKKYAAKAKNLCPELEGISQMLMTIEVYISAEEEKLPLSGGSNWYSVLGVFPHADEETIRKKYRRLAILLHPDKNRSIGAEGAFKLISQAWSLLSDKKKRMAYDKSCGAGAKFQQNGQSSYGPLDRSKQNGHHDFANTFASNHTSKSCAASKKNSSVPNSSRTVKNDTFWTVCHRCKMHYEYLRMYVNHNLLCPNCHEAYFAVETGPPSNRRPKTSLPNGGAARNNSSCQRLDSTFIRTNHSNHSNFEWIPSPKAPGAPSAVQLEKQRAQSASRKQEPCLRKNVASKKRVSAESSSHLTPAKRCKGTEESSVNREKTAKPGDFSSGIHGGTVHEENDVLKREVRLNSDIKQLLLQKTKAGIREKLNTCVSRTAVGKVVVEGALESTLENVPRNMDQTNCHLPHHESNPDSAGPCRERNLVEQISMDVSGPDFHDFDMDRRVDCFASNQVWAVYDDDDGMPRHYAMIRNVISLDPFTVKVSWLRSLMHSRASTVSWYSNGSSRTCGEFQLGKHEILISVDCFSHSIRRTSCALGPIHIYPEKGDVWALYRNWSPEWNELTPDEVVHKYDFVEVLEDHDEEHGVIVVPLIKVAGSKAVFHQHFDPDQIRRIPDDEISRFSHRVPHRIFSGDQGLKLLKGCRELDPSAVPSEILEAAASYPGDTEFPDNRESKEAVEPTTTNTNKVGGRSCEDMEFERPVQFHENSLSNMLEGIS